MRWYREGKAGEAIATGLRESLGVRLTSSDLHAIYPCELMCLFNAFASEHAFPQTSRAPFFEGRSHVHALIPWRLTICRTTSFHVG